MFILPIYPTSPSLFPLNLPPPTPILPFPSLSLMPTFSPVSVPQLLPRLSSSSVSVSRRSPRFWLASLLPLASSSSPHLSFLHSVPSQSVIVKSVERNAVNMYEARKFLLGLESNGVSSSSSVALNPSANVPSPSLICPVGLDILASAGLGLSNLGRTN